MAVPVIKDAKLTIADALFPQQQLDRILDLSRKRQRDLLTCFRAGVGGVNHLEDRSAVLAGYERLGVVLHAIDEVLELLRIPLIKSFLKDRECPALR